VLMCTGSQGEERAALSRIARGEHRSLALHRGDTVIFSARAIPGNEKAVDQIRRHLEAEGIEVLYPADARAAGATVHVSGHPARDDLTRMYGLVRPRFAVPVHGTLSHLEAHARLARTCGVERALVPEDGDIIRLAGERTAVVGTIEARRLAYDGQSLLPWDGTPTDGTQPEEHSATQPVLLAA
jgi:ribonuclease J